MCRKELCVVGDCMQMQIQSKLPAPHCIDSRVLDNMARPQGLLRVSELLRFVWKYELRADRRMPSQG